MKAKQLIEILEKFPNTRIQVWGDDKIQVEIVCDDDGTIINLKKKTA